MISQNQETIILSSHIKPSPLNNLSETITQSDFYEDKKSFFYNLRDKANGERFFVELLKHYKQSTKSDFKSFESFELNDEVNSSDEDCLNKFVKLMLILKNYYQGHEKNYSFELERLLDKKNINFFIKKSFHCYNYFRQFFSANGKSWKNRTKQFAKYPQLTIEDILKFDGQKYDPNNLKSDYDLSKTNDTVSEKPQEKMNFTHLQKMVKKHMLTISSKEISFIVGNKKTVTQEQEKNLVQDFNKTISLDCLQNFEQEYRLEQTTEFGFLFEKQFNFLLNNSKSLLGEEQAKVFNQVLNRVTKSVKSDKAVVLTPNCNIQKTDIIYKNKNKSYTRFSLKTKTSESGCAKLGICSVASFKKLTSTLTKDKRLLNYLDKVLSFEQNFVNLPISSQERIMCFLKSKGLSFFKYAFLGHHQENIKWFVLQHRSKHHIYFHEVKKMFEFFEKKLNEDGFKITVVQKNKNMFSLKFGDFFRINFEKNKSIEFELRNRNSFPLSMMLKIDLNNAFFNHVYGLSEN